MRLATFNVENLFARAKALRATSLGEANPVLAAFERFNTVSAKLAYEPADQAARIPGTVPEGVTLEDVEVREVVAHA